MAAFEVSIRDGVWMKIEGTSTVKEAADRAVQIALGAGEAPKDCFYTKVRKVSKPGFTWGVDIHVDMTPRLTVEEPRLCEPEPVDVTIQRLREDLKEALTLAVYAMDYDRSAANQCENLYRETGWDLVKCDFKPGTRYAED